MLCYAKYNRPADFKRFLIEVTFILHTGIVSYHSLVPYLDSRAVGHSAFARYCVRTTIKRTRNAKFAFRCYVRSSFDSPISLQFPTRSHSKYDMAPFFSCC